MHRNSNPSLFDATDVRDACGVGLIAHLQGRPSHEILQTALDSVQNMSHRGVSNEGGKSGDGCGLLVQKPEQFLRQQAKELFGTELDQSYAVGTIFLAQDETRASQGRRNLEIELERVGLRVLGWRKVPVNASILGPKALSTMPQIEHIFVNAGRRALRQVQGRLFIARRKAEIASQADPDFYIASLSPRLLCYKGLMVPGDLANFYPDLADPTLQTGICVYHQRFATNTLPSWKLAQPYRMLAHNGEINTIKGNRNWANARINKFRSSTLPDLQSLKTVLEEGTSDSASTDNMLELLQTGGMNLIQALRMMVPPAWQNLNRLDIDRRAFYEYCSAVMEPWDGPACLAVTDGRQAICTLDRNGLRPARYCVDRRGFLTVASEIGVYDYQQEDIEQKGRLGPGDILALDTRTGRIRHTEQIDSTLASRHPYRQWWRERSHRLGKAIPNAVPDGAESLRGDDPDCRALDSEQILRAKKLYQVTLEEQEQVLRPLAESGQEGVGSMGDDTPMPVLSRQVRPLYDNFRQQFAQVTNPPIDSLREATVMSLESRLGRLHNVFDMYAEHAHKLILQSPLLSPTKYNQLTQLESFPTHQLDLSFDPQQESIEQALHRLCADAIQAVQAGYELLILRELLPDKGQLPVHALLATGALHHSLIEAGLRCDTSIIVETASARDAHQVACLIGFGASAVYPWLAHSLLRQMSTLGQLSESAIAVGEKYRKGINKGLLKILSKMGISTIASYRGAQLFSAPGLGQEVIDLCFRGTPCPLGGMTFADLQRDIEKLDRMSKNPATPAPVGGILKYVSGGEQHAFAPEVVETLQRATSSGEYADWQRYCDLVNNRPPLALRDLLEPQRAESPLDLDKVEAAEEICKRMDSAGMSLGALSPEAHQDLARAMNSLGARSNSGEGGEDPARFKTEANSAIKQIASGRFGVTPHYLRNADVLQIKIAQGAKPGEGGQLPGRKVNRLIARLRYSVPGVTLISPPPHHDIYSIEDLKQLIYDLKQVNPGVKVSVKLVSSPGIGTIAAGVVKTGADLITISGYDGGTAASPLTSIRYAGGPWELGLVETQQTLVANDIRGQVRLQADGGLKTGRDLIKAALLGADSFGFGTAPMVALGCKYLRICHLNNCATGVATQHYRLRREHYQGTYNRVRNFFLLMAEEVRHELARLGFASLEDVIGRVDLLEALEGQTEKQQRLDLSALLENVGDEDRARRFQAAPPPDPASPLADRILQECLPHLREGTGKLTRYYNIRNKDRSIGAGLSGEIAQQYGTVEPENHAFRLNFVGCAGQSFGAFNSSGLSMHLEGECNDYVGKGMAGGQIVLRPSRSSRLPAHQTPIMGNTCLYGATGGELYAAGRAGERFAVRNSGAIAVVEGVGEHGCEYMTGGQVVVLGTVGQNFAAGMTGGFAYVLDSEHSFVDLCNRDMVALHRIAGEEAEDHRVNLQMRIEQHVRLTQSEWGRHLLDEFDFHVRNFWLVTPRAVSMETLLSSERSEAA